MHTPFLREPDFLQRSGDGASAALVLPKRCHFGSSVIAMAGDKLAELVSVRDFVTIAKRSRLFSLKISGGYLPLAATVNRVATEVEQLTQLALFMPSPSLAYSTFWRRS